MKCTNFGGPFDPFRGPAPGRPPGSKHLWGPRLGWYRSRPVQAVRANIQTGPTSKICVLWWYAPISLVHLTHSDGLPQDDLLVPSTHGDLDLVGIGPVLGQAVGANIQTGPTSQICVLWWYVPISLVHLTHSDGLPQDDLLVPSTYRDLDCVGIGPVLGQAVGANIQTGPTSKICVLWLYAQISLVHLTHSDGLPQDDLLVPSTHEDLDWVGIGPVLGQAVGANIQTGPTSRIFVLWWNAPISLVHLTHSDGLPQDDLLVPSTHEDLDWAGIGPVLGQAVGANIQTGPTSRISVLWWNAPNSLVHLTHSDGLPQDDLQVPSTHGDLYWAGIGPVLGQAVGANIQTGPTSRISVLWWNAPNSLVHLTHSDGLPQDDLLVPSTHEDLDWAGIDPVLGQAVGANIQTGPTSKISVLWWNAPISLVHLTHSDGLPQDDLLVPSTHEDLDWAGIGPVLGQAVGANIQTGPTSKISVLWWNAPISLVHLTHSDGLPQDDLLVPSTYGDLDWVGIGHVLGQAVRANIQTGPTSKICVLWWYAPISLVHLTHSDGLPQDDLLVPSTYGDLDWADIGPVLGQAVRANIQMGPTSKIYVLWWYAPISFVHLTHSDGSPRTTSWFQAPMGT